MIYDTFLTHKLASYIDEELIQYTNENAASLTVQAFKLLKKEIAGREKLPLEISVLIENIQKDRNQNFIKEIYSYIYFKSQKIKTAENLIDDLKENEISEKTMNSVLLQLPKIIDKNIKYSNNESSNGVLWLVIGIAVTITSFSLSLMVCGIGGICQIVYGLSKGFGGSNNDLVLRLKKSIEEYIENNRDEIEQALAPKYFQLIYFPYKECLPDWYWFYYYLNLNKYNSSMQDSPDFQRRSGDLAFLYYLN